MLAAQSVDDDLYYIPSKKTEKKEVVKQTRRTETPVEEHTYTTVVVKDRKGKTRDVDEYNRRYDSRHNDFSMENDTLYIQEKEYDGLDGEWVNGEFDGSQDDYEYATRIIRFRNPRYAISISSPLYWDVVYGLNSWEWNVYTDGLYAYAFPTFSNRLWWDWRYNSYGWGGYPYYGWHSWYSPTWSWGFSWGGWYGGGWWGHHHHHHYHPGYYYGSHGGSYWNDGYGSRNLYTSRRSSGPSYSSRNGISSTRRTSSSSTVNGGQTVRRSSAVQNGQGTAGQVRRSSTTTGTRRVVGTRSSSSSTRTGVSGRTDASSSSSRRSVYTRPSSTRSSGSVNGNAEGVRRSVSSGRSVSTGASQRGTSTYNRGSSATRNSSVGNETRRSNANTRSYNNSNSYGSSRSSSGFSSGGSSRSSSGGGYSGGSSRSGSGGSSRRR